MKTTNKKLAVLAAGLAGLAALAPQNLPTPVEKTMQLIGQQQQQQSSQRAPLNTFHFIKEIYVDNKKLLVGRRKAGKYSAGELSRHKQVMKCKKYCSPKKRR